jgi:glycosyltransferase involved in cell wall biosynthesis
MKKSVPIISICIPTFNGESTIKKVLDTIYPQLTSDCEVVISDDVSTDDTLLIVKQFQQKCSLIKVFQNAKNLGMDGNFHKVTKLATGKYVWFCGQDDLLGNGVIKQALKMVGNNNIGILNMNFSQYDHYMETCLTESFFEESTFDKKLVQTSDELYFDTPDEYYAVFTQPPSFLPSVVMLREYWLNTDVKQFYGSYFVQVGVLLMNMHKHRIGVFNTPLIKGRIPNDQWQHDGSKLFAIMTGDLVAKKIAFKQNRKLPYRIFQRDKLRYSLNFLFMLQKCRTTGLTPSSYTLAQLKKVFDNRFVYYLYIFPLLKMNVKVLQLLSSSLFVVKKLLLRFTRIKDLRQ